MKKGPLGQNQLQLHLYTYTYTILFPSSLPETKKNQVLQEPIMISVLAQERLLGAALGSIFTGMVVFEQRRSIYKSISDTQPQLNSQFQVREPIFGKEARSELARMWNKGVDQAFGPAIQYLNSHGW
ncbi:hypothetical protein F8388_013280 [Cannabis sativa]|uniref:Uncharacterized protein n=1 Tax=Cannabis sativa TaxID=3483 RepID=A0A7J6EDA0_CANSA|nr:hypothetical protein F8388_013280 [Cannabis sativa]